MTEKFELNPEPIENHNEQEQEQQKEQAEASFELFDQPVEKTLEQEYGLLDEIAAKKEVTPSRWPLALLATFALMTGAGCKAVHVESRGNFPESLDEARVTLGKTIQKMNEQARRRYNYSEDDSPSGHVVERYSFRHRASIGVRAKAIKPEVEIHVSESKQQSHSERKPRNRR